MSLAAGIIGGIGAATGIGGAVIQSNAAGNAADAQVNAANHAADLSKQAADNSLAFQKQVYGQQQANLSPFLKGGTSAYANLLYQMGVLPPGGGPMGGASPAATQSKLRGGSIGDGGITATPNVLNAGASPFQEFGGPSGGVAFDNNSDRPMRDGRFFPSMDGNPTNGGEFAGNGNPSGNELPQTASGDPAPTPIDLNSQVNPALGAYGSLAQDWTGKFVAPTGEEAKQDPGYQFRLDQGQGILERSAAARGGLLSGGTTQDLAKFGQDYASNEYDKTYARRLGQYTLDYNTFKQNQADKFNRLSTVAGGGQVAAQQLNAAGSQAASGVSNTYLTSAAQQGQDLTNAGSARASGYINSGNAFSGALSGIGSSATNLGLLALMDQNSPNGLGGGPCWIAAAIYGWDTPKFFAARRFIFERWQGRLADMVRKLYIRFGQRIAQHKNFCMALKPLFDMAVERGV